MFNPVSDGAVEARWDDFSLDDAHRAKRIFSRYFLALFFYNVAALVVSLLAELILIIAVGKEEAAAILENPLVTLPLGVLPSYLFGFPIFLAIVGRMRRVPRMKTKLGFGKFMIFLLVAEGLLNVGAIIGGTLNNLFSLALGYDPSIGAGEIVEKSPFLLAFFVTAILAPIFEELLFRKLLIDRIGMYGDKIAIVLSGLTFGLFHGNLYQFFFAALLGMLFAYVYTKTGNVWYTIALHSIVNAFSTLGLLILPLEEDIEDAAKYLEPNAPELSGAETLKLFGELLGVSAYSLLSYGMTIAGIILLIVLRKRVFVSDRCEVLIPRQKRASVIVGNVGMILFIVLEGLLILDSLFSPLVLAIIEKFS